MGLPTGHDGPLQCFDGAEVDAGSAGKSITTEDVHRRVVTFNDCASGSSSLRLAPVFDVTAMRPFKPSNEFRIERKGGEPKRGRAQVRAGDNANRSVAFASDFEARKMGTFNAVVRQNRC
jgi:hypothetical protein